jgi:carboxyl-terminal processing protease
MWSEIDELDTESNNLIINNSNLNNYLLTINPLKSNNKFQLESLKRTTF